MKRLSLPLIATGLLSALTLKAMPSYETTMLPSPKQIDAEDKEIVKSVVELPVYKDSEDPNKYYYKPPFRVYQYAEAGAGMILYKVKMQDLDDAKKIIAETNNVLKREITDPRLVDYLDRVNWALEDVAQVERYIETLLGEIRQWQGRRLEFLISGRDDVVAYLDQLIQEKRTEIENNRTNLVSLNEKVEQHKQELEDFKTRVTEQEIRQYLIQATIPLASAGISIHTENYPDTQLLLSTIKDTVLELEKSYGGFMSASIYTGFSAEQVEHIRRYKQKYNPNLNISLLPITSLEFFPITESMDDKSKPIVIFKKVQGAGSYEGATIVMDLTLKGAENMALSLAPFVIPIGIRGELLQAAPPFKATLDCDFTNGYKIEGRADIRDGLIIFDDDVTNTINATDSSKGACTLTQQSGDINSAHFKVLEKLKEKYGELRHDRTVLAKSEKDKYYAEVQKDIKEHRRNDNESDTTSRLREWNENTGLTDVLLDAFFGIADFHWHTNIQNVTNLSEVKFTEVIEVHGHEKVKLDVPVRLCLSFNKSKGAYDRCSDEQDKDAETLSVAISKAKASDVCTSEDSPLQCGDKRAESASDLNRGPEQERRPDNHRDI